MSYLIWLSRVALLGLAATGASAILLFSTGAKEESDSNQVIALTQENIQTWKSRVDQPPTPIIQPSSQKQSGEEKKVPERYFDLNQSLNLNASLFATHTSLGMVAIGVAEGNYRLFIENSTLYLEQTAGYFGHTDPGNLSWGEVVTNFGPCSDQGRSRGNIAKAEQMCSQRALGGLSRQLLDLNTAGIDPNADLEALLNTADLYNQARLIHSRKFPEALVLARQGGKTGVEAIAWARTASFYINEYKEFDLQQGENKASGLIGICARENLQITEWQCVYKDQLRRAQAIASVLDKYRQISVN
ncbi:MAG: hypothetical protein F6J96_00765 [Symploca sp. SIO1C2]|nr:hypothetical protein [Symploca sp. SIO1C2]